MKKKENALIVLGRLIDEQPMTDSSKRQYHCTLKSFEEFIKVKKEKSILGWDDFSLSIITEYRDWFGGHVEVHKITKERVRIEDNTVTNRMKSLYTILTYAEHKDLLDLQKTKIAKFKSVKSKMTKCEENQLYLKKDEINRLFKLKLDGIEKQVRDLFIFQVEVGQRYSDVNGLNAEPNNKSIHIIQQKTGKGIDIQLTDTAYQILSNYHFTLPSINNQKANKLIKEIAKKAKINRAFPICEFRGGKQYRYEVEAWQLIGTHTARRSFISNCLLQGIDGEIIKKQTGHSTNSAFTRYNRIQSIEASQIIAQTMDGSFQTTISSSHQSSTKELTDEIRKNLTLESEIQQYKKELKSMQSVVSIEQTLVEDEKSKKLTIEDAYRKGIPYDLFLQIQIEQDEMADNCL